MEMIQENPHLSVTEEVTLPDLGLPREEARGLIAGLPDTIIYEMERDELLRLLCSARPAFLTHETLTRLPWKDRGTLEQILFRARFSYRQKQSCPDLG